MNPTDTGQIAKALAQFQSKVVQPKKDREVRTEKYSYTYATLDTIMDAVRAPLADSGLSVAQCMTTAPDGTVLLETILLHESGERLVSLMPVKPVAAGPQAMGSAISYARRYSVAAILGVVAEDDDDARGAEGKQDKKERRAAQALEKSPPRGGNGTLVEAIGRLHASNATAGCKVPPHTTDKDWPAYAGWLKGMVESALGQPVKSLSSLTPEQVDEARTTIRRMIDNNEVQPWKGTD